jgi:hypothetical protein
MIKKKPRRVSYPEVMGFNRLNYGKRIEVENGEEPILDE